jgi:hypothetical protein
MTSVAFGPGGRHTDRQIPRGSATSAFPQGAAEEPFVGRRRVTDTLEEALDQVRRCRARIVVVEGPAGIGKSCLVDRFLQRHPDLRVMRAGGEEWEAYVPYGLVDQLLAAAGVRGADLLVSTERALPTERFGEHRPARATIESPAFGRSGEQARFMIEAAAYRG